MEEHNKPSPSVRELSLLKYWPIGAIYLLAFAIAILTAKLHVYPDYMSQVMGIVLVLFGVTKLNDISGFAQSFAKYDPVAKKFSLYAHSYPFIEILLGTLFIAQIFVTASTLVTLIIYSLSFYGALISLRNKEDLHCVCLGTYFSLPLSKVTIIESLFMICMCLWMLSMIPAMATMPM
jgi:hypothetical protein